MTKAELAAKFAEANSISKKDANSLIDSFAKIIEEELLAGGKVVIPDVGTFSVKERPARMVRNPRTGESIKVEACKAGAFKFSSHIKDMLNK